MLEKIRTMTTTSFSKLRKKREEHAHYHYAMVFTPFISRETINRILQVLTYNGLACHLLDQISKDRVILLITSTNQNKLFLQAESKGLAKELKDQNHVQALLLKHHKISQYQPNDPDQQDFSEVLPMFKEIEIPQEYRHLYKTKKLLSKRIQLYESRRLVKLKFKDYYKPLSEQGKEFSSHEFLKNLKFSDHEVFTPAEKLYLIWHLMEGIMIKDVYELLDMKKDEVLLDEKFVYYLLRKKIITKIVPMHNDDEVGALATKFMKHANPPAEAIRSYFGDQVAMFFAWVRFYSNWLLIPAIMALIIYLFHIFSQGRSFWKTIYQTESFLSPIFSAIMVIWSFLFTAFWRRKAKALQVKWGNYKSTIVDEENQRQQYRPMPMFNLVTQQMGLGFPKLEKMKRYLYSFICSLPILIGTLVLKAIFINIWGYAYEGTFLHIDFFSGMSEKGGIFDKSTWRHYLAVYGYPYITIYFSIYYRKLAWKLTENENHRTEIGFQNSYILKRFIIKFCASFLSLFYVGLVQMDIQGLRKLLISHYTTHEIRRLFFKFIVPLMQRTVSDFTLKFKELTPVQEEKNIREEINKRRYEDYDGYFELVIQFGYIILFSTALPFTCLLGIIVNHLEYRSIALKLTQLYQRPFSKRIKNIGSWLYLLEFFSFVSIYTNLVLFSATIHHFADILPSSFVPRFSILTGFGNPSTGQIMFLVGIERIFLIILLLAKVLISDTPKWIDIYFQRQKFWEKQRFQNRIKKKGRVIETLYQQQFLEEVQEMEEMDPTTLHHQSKSQIVH